MPSRNLSRCSRCSRITCCTELGYRLSSPCRSRVGILVYGRVNYLTKRVRNLTNNKSRHALRSNYWCTIALNPDDIAQGPDEIIATLKETEQELVRENQKLTKELEGKNNKRQMQLLSMYLSKAGLSYFTKHNYLLGFGKANYLYTIVLYYLIFLQRKHQSCTKL